MSEQFETRLRRVLDAHPPKRMTPGGAREAAVLIPIVAVPEPTLIFTRRTDTLPSHRGQISFPGGSIDAADASPEAAALREAHEELALQPDAVRVLGELDSVPTFVSGYLVSPVIGWLEKAPALTPNPAEVAEVLHVPVAALNEEVRSDPGFTHAGRTFPTEAWIVDGNVIWGVTARIVRLLLYRLTEAGLAEAPGDTTSPWPEAR